MIIEDEGIVIHIRAFQEKLILTCFLREHGLKSGMINRSYRGGHFSPGAIVRAIWSARLEAQLGYYKIEPIGKVTHIMGLSMSNLVLCCINSAMAIIYHTLKDGDAHTALYDDLKEVMENIERYSISDDRQHGLNFLRSYALFERSFLDKIGFGLDLSKCASSQSRENLCYISPKSGCAVSFEAGEQYKHLLFDLPRFWVASNENVGLEEILNSLKITGYFLEKRVFAHINKPLPESRNMLTRFLHNALPGAALGGVVA
jgi:DNA repair protein RecO (recombination protein O)